MLPPISLFLAKREAAASSVCTEAGEEPGLVSLASSKRLAAGGIKHSTQRVGDYRNNLDDM